MRYVIYNTDTINCSSFGQSHIENKYKWLQLFSDWEQEVFGAPINEINDTNVIWQKVSAYIRKAKNNEILKSTISQSAILFERGQASRNQHHHSHTDQFLNVMQSTNNYDRQVSKSLSLSRITGSQYRRNLLAIERHKSISNEFLNCTYFHDDQVVSNNNDDDEKILSTPLHNTMPCFGVTKLDKEDLLLIRDFLAKAFKNQYHPLGLLNAKISFCFYTSYGCWKVKPIAILSTQAMKEWESISKRIYDIIRRLYPTLPSEYGTLDE